MFLRVSIAVISKDLASELNLNARSLGLLGGAFFYSFALIQVAMGLLLDRLGPRIIVPAFAFIGSAGSFLFATGTSFDVMVFARVLMGLGMAAMLMGGFKVLSFSFPQTRFATLAGTMVAIGTLGTLAAGSPLVWASSHFGWRSVFLLTGIMAFLLGIILYWTLRLPTFTTADPSSEATSPPTIRTSMKLILASFPFWQIAVLSFFRYGTLVSLQALWLGLYLIDVENFSPLQAGNVLIALSVGYMVGSPLSGRLYDRFSHHGKVVIIIGLSVYTATLLPLLGIWQVKGDFSFMIIALAMGLFSTFGTMLYSEVKSLFPLSVAATAMTWVNFFVMLGGAVLIPFIGKLIEGYPHTNHTYPPEAYHLSFLICLISMIVSLIIYAIPYKSRDNV